MPRNAISADGAHATFTTAPFREAFGEGSGLSAVLEMTHSDGYSSSAASGPRSATKAMLLPSGDHAAASTLYAGAVMRRGLTPARSASQIDVNSSRYPAPSIRQV